METHSLWGEFSPHFMYTLGLMSYPYLDFKIQTSKLLWPATFLNMPAVSAQKLISLAFSFLFILCHWWFPFLSLEHSYAFKRMSVKSYYSSISSCFVVGKFAGYLVCHTCRNVCWTLNFSKYIFFLTGYSGFLFLLTTIRTLKCIFAIVVSSFFLKLKDSWYFFFII